MKEVYNSKELANLLQCSSRHIRNQCKEGRILGAYQVPGKKGPEWRIPADTVAALLAEREPEVEVLEPEDAGLIARETLSDFVRSIVFAEVGRNKAEIEELRKDNAELRKELAEVRKELAEQPRKITNAAWSVVLRHEEVKRKQAEENRPLAKAAKLLARLFGR